MTAFLYSPWGQLPVPETRSAAQPSQAPDRAEAAPDAHHAASGAVHMQGVTHGDVSPRLPPKFAVVGATRHGNSSGEILP